MFLQTIWKPRGGKQTLVHPQIDQPGVFGDETVKERSLNDLPPAMIADWSLNDSGGYSHSWSRPPSISGTAFRASFSIIRGVYRMLK